METLQVRPSDTRDIVLRAMKAKRPIFLWGPPGIGKSELVQQIVDSGELGNCLLYTSPSPRDGLLSRMPSSA